MRSVFIGILAVLVAAPSAAQTLRQTVTTPPPGGIEVLTDGTLVMSSDICSTLGGNQPAVPGAEYKEGVDVNGRRVAPADLPASPPPLEVENFPIEIKSSLAGKFNVPAMGGAYGAKAILGYVTVRDNRAYFNGQPLGEDQRAALDETCRAAKR